MTKTLLAVQIALTVTLVGSAGLFLQTLTNFHRIDIGFEPRQLLTATMDPGLGTLERPRAVEYVRAAADALAAVPGVHAVTYATRSMGSGVPINLAVDVPGFAPPDANAGSSGVISAGPAFVRTLGLTLLAGRDFASADREGSAAVAIVNESFATHFFGRDNALGEVFAFRGPGNLPIAIVGIVKDVRDGGLKRPTQRVVYVPFGQREVNTATFTVRASTGVAGLAESIRRTLERIDPAVGIARLRAAHAQLEDGLRRERLLAGLGAAFGGLALLLMAVGLYGMLNAMVVRRTTEIGVRMALGAKRNDIVRMIARETAAAARGRSCRRPRRIPCGGPFDSKRAVRRRGPRRHRRGRCGRGARRHRPGRGVAAGAAGDADRPDRSAAPRPRVALPRPDRAAAAVQPLPAGARRGSGAGRGRLGHAAGMGTPAWPHHGQGLAALIPNVAAACEICLPSAGRPVDSAGACSTSS